MGFRVWGYFVKSHFYQTTLYYLANNKTVRKRGAEFLKAVYR